jgi:hypothetical protein
LPSHGSSAARKRKSGLCRDMEEKKSGLPPGPA